MYNSIFSHERTENYTRSFPYNRLVTYMHSKFRKQFLQYDQSTIVMLVKRLKI